jgi:hypothetical protein
LLLAAECNIFVYNQHFINAKTGFNMDQLRPVESLGYILKKEKLATLASEINFKELILEDLDQFPAFYDQYFIPANENEKQPRSVFLILKEFDVCHEDQFIRMTSAIKQKQKIGFDAALGSLQLFNQQAPCIRVYMDDYSQIPDLLESYRSLGLHFQPNARVTPFQSLIKLRKFFMMKPMADGIYKSLEMEDVYYLQVPGFLAWNDFERITLQIRNNWTNKIYDAAQVSLYDKSGMIEMVRIFDLKADQEKLTYLRQKYSIEIERM